MKAKLLLIVCFLVGTPTSAFAEVSVNPEPKLKVADDKKDPIEPDVSDNRFFLQEIFTKYGHGGQMTFEGFEHLLESLGLGNIMIQDHDVLSHKIQDEFRDTHNTHEHSKDSNEASAAKRGIRESSFGGSVIELPMPKTLQNETHGQTNNRINSRDPKDRNHASEDHHSGNHVHKHSHSDITTTTKASKLPTSDHLESLRYTEPPESSHHDHDHGHESHDHGHEIISELSDNSTSGLSDHHKLSPCLSPAQILLTINLATNQSFDYIDFLKVCPAIVYELDQHHCHNNGHGHGNDEEGNVVTTSQWLYASLAVLLISLCGLFSVAVIPIMQKWFYHTLLQFLVGLAVGSLSGDALLHLMPHAMLGGAESHSHSTMSDESALNESMREEAAVWRGMMALGGIYFFFVAERLLNALTTYRRKKNAKLHHAPRVMIPVYGNEAVVGSSHAVGEKLSQYRKNSYGGGIGPDGKESTQMLPDPNHPPAYNETARRDSRRSSVHEVAFHGRSSFSADPQPGVIYHQAGSESNGTLDDPNFVVTVAEHHGHGHGHSHEVPQSVSAVAWMVIMGDGLHNFCDGLAIGAAFASGLAGGISTTVAVFCHELPHELGDFAMLLKTGMKVKQALMYNGLSSVLCFIGMVIGLALGNVHSATAWVFAGTAGMFMYIALVDMLPELATSTNDPGSTATYTLAIQVLGISIGVSIMLLIAIYEHDLKNMVS